MAWNKSSWRLRRSRNDLNQNPLSASAARGKHQGATSGDAHHSQQWRKRNCVVFRFGDLERTHIHFALMTRETDSSINEGDKANNNQNGSGDLHGAILSWAVASMLPESAGTRLPKSI
jgi:hypothetical protein